MISLHKLWLLLDKYRDAALPEKELGIPTYQASREIWDGEIVRGEIVDLVNKYDHVLL